MNGIILNTQAEYDALESSLHNYVQSNTIGYTATKWAKPIIGSDNTYLLLTDDSRLSGYDFSAYTIVDVPSDSEIYFPTEE